MKIILELFLKEGKFRISRNQGELNKFTNKLKLPS